RMNSQAVVPFAVSAALAVSFVLIMATDGVQCLQDIIQDGFEPFHPVCEVA
ncbi:hypothetical protein KIPB_013485, partial [Kipferlia bialata]